MKHVVDLFNSKTFQPQEGLLQLLVDLLCNQQLHQCTVSVATAVVSLYLPFNPLPFALYQFVSAYT